MAKTIFRFNLFFLAVGNILFLTLMYYLWGAIYKNSDGTINGMSLNQAFSYVSIASSIFGMFYTWTEWSLSRSIITGNIANTLVRPLEHQLQILFETIGHIFLNFIVVTVPSLFVIFIIFDTEMNLGIHVIFFIISLALGFFISFSIDYMIGLTSFYTEAIWGLSTTKEVIVLLFSGALIPLNFFPQHLKTVAYLLPFHAIYNTPIVILNSSVTHVDVLMKMLLPQLFWCIFLCIISRLFYRQAIKIMIVNGG